MNDPRRQTRQERQAACKHESMIRDRFAEIPGVRRADPGRHVCAGCGAPAEKMPDGTFRVYL